MADSKSTLENRLSRLCRAGSVLLFVQILLAPYLVTDAATMGPATIIFGAQVVFFGGAALLLWIITTGRHIRFSLSGLFISLFLLNLSLALLFGTKGETPRTIGMIGIAVWSVVMALWFVCKAIDAEEVRAKENKTRAEQ